jgi:hypothetical protein
MIEIVGPLPFGGVRVTLEKPGLNGNLVKYFPKSGQRCTIIESEPSD